MSTDPVRARPWRPRLTAVAGLAVAVSLFLLPAIATAAPTTAFVTDQQNSSLDQFTIGTGGLLSFNSSAPAGSEPWMQAVTPNGKYAYVADFQTGGVYQYAISSSGTLTPLSPSFVGTGSGRYGIAVSPDGKNVYVANDGAGSVDVYDIGSDGTLTLAQSETTDLSGPAGIAVSPDGASVYVGDQGMIVQFDRASDGTLSPKTPATVPSDFSEFGMVVITPDGTSLYAASDGSSLVDEYSIGSGGHLTAKAVPSATTGASGTTDNYALTVSPDGNSLYVPDYSNNVVYQFTIGSGGQLSEKSPFTAAAGNGSIFLWPTADGKSAYVTNYSDGTVGQYDVSSTGLLTPKATPTVSHGGSLLSIVIPPDQGPVASFTAKAAKTGKASKFDASASSDSDGTVVSYQWSFGDGTTQTTTSPTVSHTYKKAGQHKVTLTVTDDSGCSTSLVFTGQTAYCSPGAAASHTVKVAAAKKPLKLSVSPRSAKAGKSTCYAFRTTSNGHRVSRVSVKLAGHRVRTSGSGRARLCLALHKGTYTARASKSGYAAASARIRVRAAAAAAPGFTG